jgi:hypothetical protein
MRPFGGQIQSCAESQAYRLFLPYAVSESGQEFGLLARKGISEEEKGGHS